MTPNEDHLKLKINFDSVIKSARQIDKEFIDYMDYQTFKGNHFPEIFEMDYMTVLLKLLEPSKRYSDKFLESRKKRLKIENTDD